MTLRLLAMTAIIICLCACRQGRPVAVPRPQAYPRIEFSDSTFTSRDVEGVRMLFNSAATVTLRPSGAARGAWIDVTYPCMTAPSLYLTLTQTDDSTDFAYALSNRRERMALNLGQGRAELTELTAPGGWECQLLVARGLLTTPVQILAWRPGEMLSGALVVTVPDSLGSDPAFISPVVSGVERDMLVLLKNL